MSTNLPAPAARPGSLPWLARGLKIRPRHAGYIFLLNLGIAALVGIDDPRPFIHQFISIEVAGFAMAYWVRCFEPWRSGRPLRTTALAVFIAAVTGTALTVALKVGSGLSTPQYYLGGVAHLVESVVFVALNGMFISALVVSQLRDTINREALRKAEAEQLLLSRQAVEAELRLMQAQVEPHFLFNTLSNVQFLVETDPKAAARMLAHLTDYLRAAIPQLRQRSTTLAQEARLAESYLAILQMRMGPRLQYRVEIPPDLGSSEIPPMMLLSLVENAIQHGVEPSAGGSEVLVQARRSGTDALEIVVRDTGRGLLGTPGDGVGLSSIRERLQALYHGRGSIALEGNQPTGVVATLRIPL